jgi:3-dehydroquinate dehydratase
MAKERADEPDHVCIKPGISFLKRLAVADAMQHQSKTALEIHLRNIEIRNVCEPPVPAFQYRCI